MFGFFKRKSKQPKEESPLDYQGEFRRRTKMLYQKFAVESTPYDELLDAMAAVENEMNRNGGGNWNAGDYDEFLATIEHHLTRDGQFSDEQIKQIRWALEEIAECGRELKRDGESTRPIKEPVDYLVARVVDWCRTHKPDSTHAEEG